MNKVTLFYFNRHGKKIEIKAPIRELKDIKLYLMEASFTENIGTVFITDENGITRELDYYNEEL